MQMAMDCAVHFLDLSRNTGQFVGDGAFVLRLVRCDFRLLQLLEHCALLAIVARPDMDKTQA